MSAAVLAVRAGAAPQVDAAFARRLLDELASRTADPPGVTRAAYGEGEAIAHAIMRREGGALGLEPEVDAAGNLYLRLPGRDPSLPGWVLGSHLDSVPHGGNFDGAAGVVAALMAVKGLVEAGHRPRRTVTVMGIRAEESNWFPLSYLGSRAAFGILPPESFATPRSDTGRSLGRHMLEAGFRPDAVMAGDPHLRPAAVHAFVEVHIEQGPVLESAGLPVGLVTGIAGSFRYRRAKVLGAWGHSGAVPRAHRRDAVFALADLVTGLDRLWDAALGRGETATITLGEVATDAALHGFSTIPGAVSFSLDVRSPSPATLERLEGEVAGLVAEVECRRCVRFDLGDRTGSAPAALSEPLRRSFAAVAEAARIPAVELASGAGHDAAVFAGQGVPTALLFVRNQNGSHNPDEAMRIEDLAVAAELLLRRLLADEADPCGAFERGEGA